jgi:hypothetical protein
MNMPKAFGPAVFAWFLLVFLPLANAQNPPSKPGAPAKPDFAAAAQRITFSNYSGQFANHPKAVAMVKEWREKLPVMLEHIYDMTGMYLPNNGTVFVQIQDGDGGMGYGLTKRWGRGCHITMSVGNIIRHNKNGYHMFQHELVHVMLIYWMQGRDRNYPLWLHEGIASFVGGNGPDFVRMYYLMYRGQHGGDPHKTAKFMLNGFFQHVYPLDYAEEYLGFLYMWETWGRAGFHQFIRHITVDGMAWDAAIIKISRMTPEDFNSAAFNFAYQYILDLHDEIKKEEAVKKTPIEIPNPDSDPTKPNGPQPAPPKL